MKKRVISGCVLALLALALIWLDEPLPWLTAGVIFWGVMALREFNQVVGLTKAKPFAVIGTVGTVLFIISPHFDNGLEPLLAAFVAGSLLYLLKPGDRSQAFIRWAWTLAGVIYIGWLLSFIVALRGLDGGREWVFFALGVTAASDTFAYFIGRVFGKHKMAPSISPNKSWEGAVGGAVCAVIMALILKAVFDLPASYLELGLLGLAASAVGQAGDLVESLFKRNMAIKDSGNSIPGHGGFMDRMDSVVFAAVLVYYYVIIFIQ
ncbi:MAG: phosphatidate cytidylyltransferase [Dehalogenimonas sp.]|uniref:Phosphatidate cytidylyltransferase n=1 Tax=Candidatus Dehalogenimonas loeffleri TaxID=3127115 RepID=A0ABZ2J8M7_9CHLR|nr:phosphatidate cytidylyltransferase [Dehalogenimonas sp.]